MPNYRPLYLICSLLFLLTSCSSYNVQDGTAKPEQPTPNQLVQHPHRLAVGSNIHWGGKIVGIKNLKDRTILEVLALQLDSKGRPVVNSYSLGRFLAEQPEYLEPLEYAPGRLVTINGKFNGLRDGRVGQSSYRFPMVATKELLLWPRKQYRTQSGDPRVNFGIGVGSGGYRGIGVGIGF
jgi:outer membrane lipoprotein